MKTEKEFKPFSGYPVVVVVLAMIFSPLLAIYNQDYIWLLILTGIGLFLALGFLVVNPNESSVMTLF